MAPQIEWTDQRVETLLSLVVSTGAHLAAGKKSTEKWTQVNEGFFLKENSEFKAPHFVKNFRAQGDFRKIRGQFGK